LRSLQPFELFRVRPKQTRSPSRMLRWSMSRVEKISPDMTVLISGQKIREVGSSRVVHVPKKGTLHGCSRQIPRPRSLGHARPQLMGRRAPRYVFPLFLANGVTGVREMGRPMPAADQVRWRDQVASGAVIGPRLVVPGPFVDGPHPVARLYQGCYRRGWQRSCRFAQICQSGLLEGLHRRIPGRLFRHC
jgi:hypothetical protein